MHAMEKKADYGQFSCSFDVSLDSDLGGNIFIVIQKQKGDQSDKYTPIFKSECKKASKGKTEWNTVYTDTDTLADSQDDKNLMI